MSLPINPDWRDSASCNGQDVNGFYPEKGGSTAFAKFLCSRCEVQDECLSTALWFGDRHGVWGGLSERERRAVRTGVERAPETVVKIVTDIRTRSYQRAKVQYGGKGVGIGIKDGTA